MQVSKLNRLNQTELVRIRIRPEYSNSKTHRKPFNSNTVYSFIFQRFCHRSDTIPNKSNIDYSPWCITMVRMPPRAITLQTFSIAVIWIGFATTTALWNGWRKNKCCIRTHRGYHIYYIIGDVIQCNRIRRRPPPPQPQTINRNQTLPTEHPVTAVLGWGENSVWVAGHLL